MSVLGELLERLRDARPRPPVVVFDLDSTLLSTQQRNHVILQEFVSDVGAPDAFFVAAGKLLPEKLGWNLMDDLRRLGFQHEATLVRLRSFWQSRFFHDAYLHHDQPLPGAVEFVTDAHSAGGTIYYLSGRDEPNMGRGTRSSLRSHGFPLESDRVVLRLKTRFEEEDLAFKRSVVKEIQGLGEVVGIFENEPANANFFHEAFPEAQVIFLETAHSPNPPPLAPGIVRLRDFRR